MYGVFIFLIGKTAAKMFKLPKTSLSKLLAKPTKEKDKEKKATIYQKFVPSEALVDREG
jgi:hypothetical protein